MKELYSNFYTETINKNYSNKIKNLKLIFDKKNNPNVIFSTAINSKSKIIILKQGGFYGGWNEDNIASINFSRQGLKDTYDNSFSLDNIKAIDAMYDRKNSLRMNIAEDNNVYYLKQYSKGNTSDFRIDRIATNVGASALVIDIDKKDRLTVVYRYDKKDWIRLWLEPTSFDYQDKAPIIKVMNDEISEESGNLLSLLSLEEEVADINISN